MDIINWIICHGIGLLLLYIFIIVINIYIGEFSDNKWALKLARIMILILTTLLGIFLFFGMIYELVKTC